MSQILRILKEHGSAPTWWLILDCGHWYHWTGMAQPIGDDFNCSACRPTIKVK